MKTINVNETIEKFLSGSASTEEKAWLANEMKANAGLSREVELRKRTDNILADRSIIELRGKLEAVEMRKRSGGVMRKTVIKVAKYAAAVLCIALISSAIYLPSRNITADRLYERYFTPYEMPGASRSVSSVNDELMGNAMISYSQGNYKEAIGYLEKIVASERNNMESVFMYGVSNMAAKNYPVAVTSFNKVLQQNDNLYLEDASWYLGLSYMMDKEKDKAIRQFEFIAASKSRYSKDAKKLLKHID